MINALKGSCFYCGGFVGTDGHPFVFAPMPPRGDGLGWTLEPVCFISEYGERCMDHYADRLHEYWRRLDQKRPA